MLAWAQLIVQPTEQECPNRSKEAGGLGVIAICSYSGCLELFKCCTKDLQPEPGCPDDMDYEKLYLLFMLSAEMKQQIPIGSFLIQDRLSII